jgi:putative ABC transport system permease protein
MNVNEAFAGAVLSLGKHKLRTALTMLGMVFGVGAVIAMLSIGGGAAKSAVAAVEKLGAHNVIVRSTRIRSTELADVRKKSLGVSMRDAEAISESVAGVELVVPRIEVETYKIMSREAKAKGKLIGISWRQPYVAAVALSEGRFFQRDEEEQHRQVCVIGDVLRRDLFGLSPAIGRQIKVNDVWLEVVGVLAASDSSRQNGLLGSVPTTSTARQILIPFTTAARKFDRDPLEAPVDELTIKLKEDAQPTQAAELIRPLLERLHSGAEDYEVVVPEALLEQSRKTQRIFDIVMGSIAGISLLVGGIGIMNIMLASVLERTREIGIRRAVGAKARDIRNLFIIESFAISIIGGAMGIAIGIALAGFVAAFAGWPTVVSAWSIVLATGVSASVGWLSGVYPATRAAKLDPIEALRYE